jgi:hypothetical protein
MRSREPGLEIQIDIVERQSARGQQTADDFGQAVRLRHGQAGPRIACTVDPAPTG